MIYQDTPEDHCKVIMYPYPFQGLLQHIHFSLKGLLRYA